jgi:hypothetical protein
MRHCRGFIYLMLVFLLGAIPCPAAMPTPTGASTMPDLQPASMDDITLAPIVYQAPSLSDIGMKLITFEGPDLADITLDPIQFAPKTLGPAPTPSAAQSVSPSAASTAAALIAKPIPGVQPGLKILSPKPGQRFAGSVPLEVEITGWQGIPRVNLSWWWSATVPAGQWPATPQEMTVVNHLDGKTRLVIPRSAFSKSGLWRVEASVRTGENQKVVKDVTFTVAEFLKPTGNANPVQVAPKPAAPGAATITPAAPKPLQPQPAKPTRKRIEVE